MTKTTDSRPGGTPARIREATEHRRTTLMQTALEVFAEQGYERASLNDIVKRANASIGSLYHHFSSKEGLAQAVYLEGIRRTQAYGLQRLVRARSAERGVRVLAESYLDWVGEHPVWARFLFAHRGAAFMLPAEDEVAALNREVFAQGRTWFARKAEQGEFPPNLDPALVSAVIYGPASEYAKRWLQSEGTIAELTKAKRKLSDAAWAAVQALASSTCAPSREK